MKKIIFCILLLAVIMTATGCIGSVNNFNDYAANAQSDAQYMADNIMGELEKLQPTTNPEE